MIGEYESYLAIDCEDKYVVTPILQHNTNIDYKEKYGNKFCDQGSIYSSDKNELISDDRLKKMIEIYKTENNII